MGRQRQQNDGQSEEIYASCMGSASIDYDNKVLARFDQSCTPLFIGEGNSENECWGEILQMRDTCTSGHYDC